MVISLPLSFFVLTHLDTQNGCCCMSTSFLMIIKIKLHSTIVFRTVLTKKTHSWNTRILRTRPDLSGALQELLCAYVMGHTSGTFLSFWLYCSTALSCQTKLDLKSNSSLRGWYLDQVYMTGTTCLHRPLTLLTHKSNSLGKTLITTDLVGLCSDYPGNLETEVYMKPTHTDT